MARKPKPWYNAERKAWYVTVKGKRHRLAEDKKEADRAFYALMLAEGEIVLQQEHILVADAVEAMLASIQRHRPNTRQLYLYNLGPFAAHFASRRLDSVTSDEVLGFVADYDGRLNKKKFGDSSRSLMLKQIKTFFRWARDIGLIQQNCMHGKDGPWRVTPRTRAMTEDEYWTIIACPNLNRRFKEVVEFMWRTGARPGEIAAIQACHLDARQPIVRLQPTEHKTGTRTGRQREIFIPPDLMDRLRGYAKERPRGALLRNTRGNPWSQDLISVTFGALKKRLGLSDDLVLYMARHAFATRLVKPGSDLALVAKLLGHSNAEVLQKTYYHPDTKAMAAMVEQEFAGDGEKTAQIHQETEDARKERKNRLKRESYHRCKRLKTDTPPGA